jgi:hypothetical protein
MLNGAYSAMLAKRSRRVASQVHTASRDSKAYGTLRERFAQNDSESFDIVDGALHLPWGNANAPYSYLYFCIKILNCLE